MTTVVAQFLRGSFSLFFNSLCHSFTGTSWDHLSDKLTTPNPCLGVGFWGNPNQERRSSLWVRNHQNMAQNCSFSLDPVEQTWAQPTTGRCPAETDWQPEAELPIQAHFSQSTVNVKTQEYENKCLYATEILWHTAQWSCSENMRQTMSVTASPLSCFCPRLCPAETQQ